MRFDSPLQAASGFNPSVKVAAADNHMHPNKLSEATTRRSQIVSASEEQENQEEETIKVVVRNVVPGASTTDFKVVLTEKQYLGFSTVVEVRELPSKSSDDDGLTFEVLLRGRSDVGNLIAAFNDPETDFDGRKLHAEILPVYQAKQKAKPSSTHTSPSNSTEGDKEAAETGSTSSFTTESGRVSSNGYRDDGTIPQTPSEVSDADSDATVKNAPGTGLPAPTQRQSAVLNPTAPRYLPFKKRLAITAPTTSAVRTPGTTLANMPSSPQDGSNRRLDTTEMYQTLSEGSDFLKIRPNLAAPIRLPPVRELPRTIDPRIPGASCRLTMGPGAPGTQKAVTFNLQPSADPQGFTSAVAEDQQNNKARTMKAEAVPFEPSRGTNRTSTGDAQEKECVQIAGIAAVKLDGPSTTSSASLKPLLKDIPSKTPSLTSIQRQKGLAVSVFQPGAKSFIPAKAYTASPQIRTYNPEAAPFKPNQATSGLHGKPSKPFPSYFPVAFIDTLHHAGMLSVEDARDTLDDLDSAFAFVKQLAVREPDVLSCFATEFSLVSKLAKLLKLSPFDKPMPYSASEVDYASLASVSIYCNAQCLEVLQWAGITFVEEAQELLSFPEAVPIFVERLAKRRPDVLSTFRATFDLSNRLNKMLGYEI